MPCFVIGDADPVGVVRVRQAAEAVNRIPGEVDRVEFDMRDGVDEGGAAFEGAEAAFGQVARMDEFRPVRATRHADRIGWWRLRRGLQLTAGESRCCRKGSRNLLLRK